MTRLTADPGVDPAHGQVAAHRLPFQGECDPLQTLTGTAFDEDDAARFEVLAQQFERARGMGAGIMHGFHRHASSAGAGRVESMVGRTRLAKVAIWPVSRDRGRALARAQSPPPHGAGPGVCGVDPRFGPTVR